jgi:Dna[CI] antecedent, DciA
MSPSRGIGDNRVPARRRLQRVGDLLPDAARALGLEEQLRWARAEMAWQALLESRVPAAAGGSRPLRVERDGTLIIEAAAPIIGQEIRLYEDELLEAFARIPGGVSANRLRVVVARGIIP